MSAQDQNFNVRLPASLIAEVQTRLDELKKGKTGPQRTAVNQTSLIKSLFEDWLGGKRVVEMQPPASTPKAVQDDLERLKLILEHGEPGERDPIRGLLKTVSAGVEARVSQNPSRPRTKPKPQKRAG